MRHIDLNQLLAEIFADGDRNAAKIRLARAHKKAETTPSTRDPKYVRRNGPNKWSPLKKLLTDRLGRKCWYTEVELIGAPLTIDHYRPFCEYWWLAYDAENYRVACAWANSPEHNAEHGCAGGKGDNFPLLPPGQRATDRNALANEFPVILDPCRADDCELLAFQVDGRPVLHPNYLDNPIARDRVEKSLLLLNIDHPDFNSRREQLCSQIKERVKSHEDLPPHSQQRQIIRAQLKAALDPTAPFSTAARFYLGIHRHLKWVQDILDEA